MGKKGFTAVGLSEILSEANVPKGSFYYYFQSKDAFGEALLETYFATYLQEINATLIENERPVAERLMAYWNNWLETQAGTAPEYYCLVVKLGAEVSDLSEAMRLILDQGTRQVIERIAMCIDLGVADGSLPKNLHSHETAEMLYQLWLGATLLAKTAHNRRPLESAMTVTRKILKLNDPSPS
jgi:TetR/AcrR family transcriptional repressor of nem operon